MDDETAGQPQQKSPGLVSRRRLRLALYLLMTAAVIGLGLFFGGVLLHGPSSTPTPMPSPTILSIGVQVGSEVDCSTPPMKRHCDVWVATALSQSGFYAKDVASSTIHLGWSTVDRTLEVRIVVEFRLKDGVIDFKPLFCGPDNWASICDTSDVSLPPR